MTNTEHHPVVTELIWLDPRVLTPDPDNPRGELRYIEELAETMKGGVGVLEPITFREVPSGNGQEPTFVIVRGHRRREAAILADIGSVPCVPEGLAESERGRATKRMIENLARDDFSPVEAARGVQQLLDLGMSEEEISKGLALAPAVVAATARVARSAVAQAVAEKHDLTLDQALALAEFEEDRDVVVALTKVAVKRPEDFDHTVARIRKARADAEQLAAAVERWTKRGYLILESFDHSATGSGKACRIDYLRGTAKGSMTSKDHARCPGRAVKLSIGWNGKLQTNELCTDWKGNSHKLMYPSTRQPRKDAASPAEAEKATQERRLHLAGINASRAAQDVRRAFVAGVLKRKAPPKGTLRLGIEDLARDCYFDPGATPMYRELTGLSGSSSADVQRAYVQTLSDAQLPLALLARAAASIESGWEPRTWNPRDEVKARRKAYLSLLIAAGYTPSTVERAGIFGTNVDQVLVEAAEVKAAAKALKASTPATKAAPVKKAAKKAPAGRAVRRAVRRAPAKPA
jgi:ParB family chromosome partitioning protein